MKQFFVSFEQFTLRQTWRQGMLSFVLGLLAGFAFSPFHFVPLLWVSFPCLVLLLRGAGGRARAFLLGWSFSFGLLIVCLHWIAASLFVDIASFWWALPLAVGVLPAFLALIYGTAAMLAYAWGLKRVDGVLFFSICWMMAELARAHLLTGLPWDILGYVWADFLPVLQSVSLFGVEGLTFVTLFLAVLPALFFYPKDKKVARMLVVVGFVSFSFLFLWGYFRLSSAPHEYVENVRLRLVQPNQDQAMKWREDQRLDNFLHLLDISFGHEEDAQVTHFIWPETATAYYLTEAPGVRQRIAERMPQKSILLTGVIRRQEDQEGRLHYYNSLIAMNSRGDVVAGYDKHHLVPFGEYFPFNSLFSFRVVTALGVDFTEGEGIRSLRVPGLPPFGPLVCYEAIFSGEVAERGDPPHLLINLTNDAWYEGSIGIAQHFSMVRVRAVEEGVPLVRVANKGVTGVIDPWGRVVKKIMVKEKPFVDSVLPRALKDKTYFQKQQIKPMWLMVLGLFIGIFLLRLRVGFFFKKR